MKKRINLWALMCLILFSCGGDDDSSGDKLPSAQESTFSYKEDGSQVSVKGLLAYAVKFSDDFAVYGLEGVNGDKRTCYISMPDSIGVGTHPFSSEIAGYFIDDDKKTFVSLFGGSGSLTIERISASHIKGTFSFTANDDISSPTRTVHITDGAFNVKFR